MELKYIMTDETKAVGPRTLHRIQAVKDFGDVKAGDLGGWIEKGTNLSHLGTCWVYDDADVYDDAVVFGNATIHDNSAICDHASVHEYATVRDDALVYDNAIVYGTAKICDSAAIFGNAEVYRNAKICDNASVFGNALIIDDAFVCDNTEISSHTIIYGNAMIYGNVIIDKDVRIGSHGFIFSPNDYLVIGPIGSRNDYTTFYRTDEGIWVSCGCFNGSVEEFETQVVRKHNGTRYMEDYYYAAMFASKKLEHS